MATPYLYYKFDKDSTTVTNYGSGGSGYNGTATRAQYATDSAGYPVWGPMTDNNDRITVPGGCSNPYQHTWEIGLNINHWWPGNGDDGGVAQGNDGKLWALANDLFYGYFHGVCGFGANCSGGALVGTSNVYNFTVEAQGSPSSLDVDLWLGVGDNKPVQIGNDGLGTDDPGALYLAFNYNFQLNTNYYLQITVDCDGGPGGNDYYISNCAPGCADSSVQGFPSGCYFYVWREYNSIIDLSGGGDWATDVVLWKGGTPSPTPTPTPTPTPSSGIPITYSIIPREYQGGFR
jgi:hypothetical protein